MKKGSGFQGTPIGTVHPKGTTIKRDKNGRIVVVPPSGKNSSGKKKK